MAWIICKKCGKRISDKDNKCYKCGTKIKNISSKKNYKNIILKSLFIVVQVIVIGLLIVMSKDVMFSGDVSELYILFGLDLILIINIFIMGNSLLKIKEKSLLWYGLCFFCGISALFGIFFGYRSLNALKYDNSIELYNLCERYDIDEAKKIKKTIEDIFEYDFDEVSSRNIIIGNLYEDEEFHVLYIDDFYGNFSLKFYLKMNNDKIEDIFWYFDNDTKLYLYRNGKKTDDFAYYYAMYIVKSLVGENVKGLATIEEDAEKIVRKEFSESANAIFTYDELIFNEKENTFTYKCIVENMDYYADIEDKEFEIEFIRLSEAKNKKVWYYGDSSFDYVNWSVNI